MIYPKPYSIYLRGIILTGEVRFKVSKSTSSSRISPQQIPGVQMSSVFLVSKPSKIIFRL